MSMDIGSKKVKSDINVTPLVDVVLVLLIIFMVITPLLQRGKAVQLPDARYVSELKKGDPILVSITRDGKIWFDKDEVPKSEISQQLELHMQMMPGAPVLVKVDRDVSYKTVREVVLEISKTHILGVSLAATQQKEK
jgi:biopolymer transport protein TolR